MRLSCLSATISQYIYRNRFPYFAHDIFNTKLITAIITELYKRFTKYIQFIVGCTINGTTIQSFNDSNVHFNFNVNLERQKIASFWRRWHLSFNSTNTAHTHQHTKNDTKRLLPFCLICSFIFLQYSSLHGLPEHFTVFIITNVCIEPFLFRLFGCFFIWIGLIFNFVSSVRSLSMCVFLFCVSIESCYNSMEYRLPIIIILHIQHSIHFFNIVIQPVSVLDVVSDVKWYPYVWYPM